MALPETINSNGGKCMVCVKAQEYEDLKSISKINGPNSLYNVPGLFLATKGTDFRKAILTTAQAIAEFLTKNHLCINSLSERYHQNPDHFHFNFSDLNEEGNKFIKAEFYNWLKNIDRWKCEVLPPIQKYKQSLERAFRKHNSKKH
jgi:hypothetical protein